VTELLTLRLASARASEIFQLAEPGFSRPLRLRNRCSAPVVANLPVVFWSRPCELWATLYPFSEKIPTLGRFLHYAENSCCSPLAFFVPLPSLPLISLNLCN
jgi:hypothetical protein